VTRTLHPVEVGPRIEPWRLFSSHFYRVFLSKDAKGLLIPLLPFCPMFPLDLFFCGWFPLIPVSPRFGDLDEGTGLYLGVEWVTSADLADLPYLGDGRSSSSWPADASFLDGPVPRNPVAHSFLSENSHGSSSTGSLPPPRQRCLLDSDLLLLNLKIPPFFYSFRRFLAFILLVA